MAIIKILNMLSFVKISLDLTTEKLLVVLVRLVESHA